MKLTTEDVVLVTGATGLVGSHVAERLRQLDVKVRALSRASADQSLLKEWGVEISEGDLSDTESLRRAANGATVVVHCAAKVGDWGPTESYRSINVDGTRALLDAAQASGSLKRWVQISSLGVYAARDHHGTDESEPPNKEGIDGYTLTKVESEELVTDRMATGDLPAVVLRPGFIYGPRDRTVLPRLMEKLETGKFAFLGSRDKLMNNTFVGNLCEAIELAIQNDDAVGKIFNIRDPRAVSKGEFMDTICEVAGYEKPKKVVPLPVAKFLAWAMEGTAKLLKKKEAPLLNSARIKFLALNLDFSIDAATQQLGYQPSHDFKEAMKTTVEWFKTQKR